MQLSDDHELVSRIDPEHLIMSGDIRGITGQSIQHQVQESVDRYMAYSQSNNHDVASLFSPIVFDTPYRGRNHERMPRPIEAEQQAESLMSDLHASTLCPPFFPPAK